ncbi:MAG: lysophospholipid acyltransferase family protein [Bacillota bacterium]|nr:lysophospholipid acyltransferase family protein [Bacillota bacterium]
MCCSISTFPLHKRHETMPYHRLRCLLRGLSDFLVRLMFRLSYDGLEHIPDQGPAILIANHTSMLDMFAIHARVGPWVHWVAKKELFRHPWSSRLLHQLGCIPVNRGKADTAAVRGIMGALKQSQIVGMFPQATRVLPDQIAQVRPRSGAAHFAVRTGIPLLPVAIDGRFRLFAKVRIVFGQPFTLAKTDNPAGDNTYMDALSLHIMQRVYDLIGQKNIYGQINFTRSK